MGGTNAKDVARRALVEAAQKLGGMAALASRLGLAQGTLRIYLMGSEPIPDSLFLRIVDILQPQPAPPAPPPPSQAPTTDDAKG